VTDRPLIPPSLSAKLAKLGIVQPQDLLLHFPLRYEDQTRLTPLSAVAPGEAWLCEGVVDACEIKFKPRRQLIAHISEGIAGLTLRFFHFYPSTQVQLKIGTRVRVYGDVRDGYHGLEIVHPTVKRVDEGDAVNEALTPIYPTLNGLAQSAWRTMMARALKVPSYFIDSIPAAQIRAFSLLSFEKSVRTLHAPTPEDSLSALEARTHAAWQRIKFDELLAQQIALKRARLEKESETAPQVKGNGTLTKQLLARAGFTLTAAQRNAAEEIVRDLKKPAPMQRLLQGDVGSGKTIVAAIAALSAVEAGYQAAFMAPTEILAEQHFRKLIYWMQGLPVRIVWLTGSLPAAQARAAREACASGAAQIIVGTHALFQNKVHIPKLALAIVDEQHRFGVMQRVKLRSRNLAPEDLSGAAPAHLLPSPRGGGTEGEGDSQSVSLKSAKILSPNPSPPGGGGQQYVPHQLMMSATPIPRSLAMTYYADLDVSTLNELPKGRQPIATKLVSQSRRDEIVTRVGQICAAGTQVFWVCPLIEESEKLDLVNATQTYEEIQAALPETKIGLLHGRMKPDEKAAIMQAFIARDIQLLVATTVIEVGVDVPNANWIVIEHAERFGLSQLHQLRGRVGRGSEAATCVLLYGEKLSDTAKARLKVIYEHTDGFEIAREDLRIRGPGELLGPRQSGVPGLRYANLEEDMALVEHVREAATQLENDPSFNAQAHLDRWLPQRGEFVKS
jgi:ATP-dependent DNA helicase RecG